MMSKGIWRLLLFALAWACCMAAAAAQNPAVTIDTSLGRIVVELDPVKALRYE